MSTNATIRKPKAVNVEKPAVGLAIDALTDDIHEFKVLETAVFGDHSSYAIGAWDQLPALITKVVEAVNPWYVAYTGFEGQSATIAKTDLDIRRLHLRPDGQPDWAGLTYAYRESTEKRIDAALTAAGVNLTTPEGKKVKERLNGKVREYRSFNQLVPVAIVKDLVAKDPEFAATVHKEAGVERTFAAIVDNIDKGVPTNLPKAMQSAIGAVYATQTGSTGKPYTGFKPTDVPKVLGGTRKRATGTGGGSKSKKAPAPSASWAQIRSDLENGKLSKKDACMQTWAVLTSLADFLNGKPGKTAPDFTGAERKDVGTILGNMQNLLNGMVGTNDQDDPNYNRDDYKPFRKVISTK